MHYAAYSTCELVVLVYALYAAQSKTTDCKLEWSLQPGRASENLPVFLLGNSGPSSASLAHLLSSIFALDFCKDISLIPTCNGYIDAIGPKGLDFEILVKTLDYVREGEWGGKPPDSLKSWQYDVSTRIRKRWYQRIL